MMFLQFFIWAAWFVTLSTYLGQGLKLQWDFIGRAYSTMPLGAIVAPFLVGMIADRFCAAEKMLGILHLLGPAILYYASSVREPAVVSWVLLAYALCYNPTLAHSWSRFWRDPLRSGIAEYIVEQEQLTARFVADLSALDRSEALVKHLDRTDAESPRTALIQAQVASMTHRFADARSYLAKASTGGESSEERFLVWATRFKMKKDYDEGDLDFFDDWIVTSGIGKSRCGGIGMWYLQASSTSEVVRLYLAHIGLTLNQVLGPI
jgi:Nucleoside H+ symporter